MNVHERGEVELGLRLADTARLAALGASGQETLVQSILRQGMVTPLTDRVGDLGRAVALLEEPLVEDQAYDLLSWLLQVAGDKPVVAGPDKGVQLLFQSVNSGYGWVRFFRVESEIYQKKAEKAYRSLIRLAAEEQTPITQGLLGLPIGAQLDEVAVEALLAQTRWKTGHWMAAAYIPHRNGFAPLGLGYTLLSPLSKGEALLKDGSPLVSALLEEPDLDILPGRGNSSGLGALWGGEAFVEGLSSGLKGACRVDIQWEPVPYERLRGGGPFLGVEVPGAEQGLLGVLVAAPTNRILVAFEACEDPDSVALGVLDQESLAYLKAQFSVREEGGRAFLRKIHICEMALNGLPIWNRMLRSI